MATSATEARHALAAGLQSLPAADVLPGCSTAQRAAAAQVAPALPAIAAAADGGGGRARRRPQARLCRRRQLGADGARRRAGARRHLRHRRPSGPRCSSPAAPRRCSRSPDAAEDDTGDAAREVAAARPRRRRRGDLRLGQRQHALHARGRRGGARRAAPRSSASPTSRAAALLALADVPVLLDTGPELVAGSTRMGAATAQKIALNMISTLAGLRLGHVHDGYMVNVVADNAKLRGRAARIVAAVAGHGRPEARGGARGDRRRGQARGADRRRARATDTTPASCSPRAADTSDRRSTRCAAGRLRPGPTSPPTGRTTRCN